MFERKRNNSRINGRGHFATFENRQRKNRFARMFEDNEGVLTQDDVDECGCGDCKDDEEIVERHNVKRVHGGLSHRPMNEKRQSCCPPKRRPTALRNVQEILESVRTKDAKVYENALNKITKDKSNNSKQQAINEAYKNLGKKKADMVIKAVKEKRAYLYESVTVNKKNLSECKSSEIRAFYSQVKKQISNL